MQAADETRAGAGARAGLPAHEQVYRRLRDAVLFGELEPGQPVTIQGLTERLDVGMTPVREALRRLTAEGALEFRGNRRISVPALDAFALEELTWARLALEPELARRAAGRVDDAAIEALRGVDVRLDAAIAAADVAGYLRENHSFHSGIYALAGAPILQGMVEGLWLRFGPSLRVVCEGGGTLGLPDRHKDMLRALAARDAAAVSQAMAEDVRQGMERIAARLTAPEGLG